jgi:hypothetical protein
MKINYLIGSGVALIALMCFWIPALVTAMDFDSAPTCNAAPNSTCVVRQETTVQQVGSTPKGRSTNYWIALTGFGQILLPSEDDAWKTAHAGDPAVAVIWRDRVAAIEVRGVTSATDESPDEQVNAWTAAFVVALGALTGAILLAVRDRVRWLARCGPAYPLWALFSGVGIGLAIVINNVLLWIATPLLSAVVAVLIAVEFFVLQPRVEADRALEEAAKKYL